MGFPINISNLAPQAPLSSKEEITRVQQQAPIEKLIAEIRIWTRLFYPISLSKPQGFRTNVDTNFAFTDDVLQNEPRESHSINETQEPIILEITVRVYWVGYLDATNPLCPCIIIWPYWRHAQYYNGQKTFPSVQHDLTCPPSLLYKYSLP